MTINEAIMKSELGMTYSDAEHDQLIEWLKELKKIREWKSDIIYGFCKYDVSSFEELIAKTREKSIDDFAEKLCDEVESFTATVNGVKADVLTLDYLTEFVVKMAEQLKSENQTLEG